MQLYPIFLIYLDVEPVDIILILFFLNILQTKSKFILLKTEMSAY